MGKDRVKITGDWSAWAEPVRQGRLSRPDGETVWVLIRTRPDLMVDEDGFGQFKQESRIMARLEHPSILRLLHVTRVDGQVAWVYEGAQAVSIARALDVANARGEFFPAKAAVEVVERAVQGIRAALTQGEDLQAAEMSVVHLGPSPSEILVDAVGAVRVAGFSLAKGERAQQRAPTGYAPAQPGTAEQRAAYGIGVLLVHLLGGERPSEAGIELSRQNAVIRRAMIRVLARPGEAVPDVLTELIRRTLDFDAENRPDLMEIQDVLSASAQQLRSAGLRTWAPSTIPNLLTLQDTGYPDPDTARMRRHIDPSDDGSNFAPPPVRKRVPREVSTMVGRPSVDPKTLQPYEADPNEATPYLGSQSLDSMPTSETDVASLEATKISQGLGEGVLNVQFDKDDDTWEVETQEDHGRLRVRPLLGGLVLGMILAVGLGQYVVEPMVTGATDQVTLATPTPPPLAVPEVAARDAVEELAEAADTGGDAPELPEASEAPEVDADPEVEETAPAPTVPAAEPPVRPRPKPAETKKTEPATAAPVPEEFTVTFRSGDPSIDRMVVRCHKGGTVTGTSVVHIVRAGKGPCKVEGHKGAVKHSVSAVLTGPKNYTCFKDGARRCE